MHPLPLFATCSLLLAALPTRLPGQASGTALKNFTAETGTVKSDKVRDGEAGYTIYLPKGYADDANKDTKYPWVLWLPGFGGANEFGNEGGATVLDALRGEGKIPPMAFVAFRPAGRGRSVYTNGEAAADTEDLLIGDFSEQLQAKYRLADDKKQRAVMGVSAGGFGALKLALRHPDVFGAVAAHSAAILPADPEELVGSTEQMVQRMIQRGMAKEFGDPIDKAKWQAHMPLAIVALKKPEELKGLQIYFDAGTDDAYDFCRPNEDLDKAMTAAGHKHLFRKVEGGGHAFGSPSMKGNVAVSLQFCGAAFAGKDAVAVMTEATAPKQADKKAEKQDGAKPEGTPK